MGGTFHHEGRQPVSAAPRPAARAGRKRVLDLSVYDLVRPQSHRAAPPAERRQGGVPVARPGPPGQRSRHRRVTPRKTVLAHSPPLIVDRYLRFPGGRCPRSRNPAIPDRGHHGVLLREDIVSWARQQPGFVSGQWLLGPGQDHGMGAVVFASRMPPQPQRRTHALLRHLGACLVCGRSGERGGDRGEAQDVLGVGQVGEGDEYGLHAAVSEQPVAADVIVGSAGVVALGEGGGGSPAA